MEKELDYYTLAEIDYHYLSTIKDLNVFSTLFCVNAQNTCEKYLKHIIKVSRIYNDNNGIFKTHALNKLAHGINSSNIPIIKLDKKYLVYVCTTNLIGILVNIVILLISRMLLNVGMY